MFFTHGLHSRLEYLGDELMRDLKMEFQLGLLERYDFTVDPGLDYFLRVIRSTRDCAVKVKCIAHQLRISLSKDRLSA